MTSPFELPRKAALAGAAAVLLLGITCFPFPLYAEENTSSGTTEMTLSSVEDMVLSQEDAAEQPTELAKTSDTTAAVPALTIAIGAAGIIISLHRLSHPYNQAGDKQ